ncbi:hypothetical protein B5K08_09880 [Rhizobium leguminosarum bv. trifolii]|uniref:Prohead serine protease domain-containing protein n=1 Tax=Rhizobium leguminosarum bv. trifolii TaxID=386 RepID=A0A3E1BPR3_RHILT|nr:HK97 family phage prohead protease [Rhizobium leguminosarum]RFB94484.1 hypothetical protein B5K08_09880 [Rhizobium leguminosarum bv. trifolii]RFB95856.1 hypothetical protein B5K10_09865 [Rhizobium leguminosarum bv. trifolii]
MSTDALCARYAQVVGTWDAVSVEADGLKVSGKLLGEDVARAKEVRALLRAKSVTGLSVGFMTKKAAPRKGGGRTISDLGLVAVRVGAWKRHFESFLQPTAGDQ